MTIQGRKVAPWFPDTIQSAGNFDSKQKGECRSIDS